MICHDEYLCKNYIKLELIFSKFTGKMSYTVDGDELLLKYALVAQITIPRTNKFQSVGKEWKSSFFSLL